MRIGSNVGCDIVDSAGVTGVVLDVNIGEEDLKATVTREGNLLANVVMVVKLVVMEEFVGNGEYERSTVWRL